ncbi:MAG: serine/threonine protein kinase [Myxococcales bacterium]|nr:serine/threonine protein kinase [Myxococcales bacterium]
MAMDQPLISRTLGGRFKLTGHIGEGAMASVFRGTDLSRPDGGEVAVKIMHPHLAVDYTFTARFKREAEAASMVKHPNSVAILDVGEEQGIHYIVMELCPGQDLRDTLKAERRLSEPRAVRIIMSICQALGAAHQLGVVHRDLKPENVMVELDPRSGTDHVKVLDFGIAKLVDAQPKARISSNPPDSDPPPALTQMGVVIGTPQYMSPEQCRGQPLDGRSDLYTCGILLYQLTTGVVPFNSESPVEVAGKQAFEAPLPPRTHLPSLDADLEGIILKCLSKAPAERPQSATELHEMLSQWLTANAAKGGPVAPTSLRDLQKTLPLNAVARSVEDYLKSQGGVLPPQAPAAPATASPPFTPPRPAAGTPARPALDTAIETDGREQPPLPPIPAPPTNAAPIVPHPPVGPAPYPIGATTGQEPAPEELPRAGWGAFGYFMVLLSLAAGVGVGFALFRFAPF